MKKKVMALLTALMLVCASLTGCTEAYKVSNNISQEADNFNVTRKLTVLNARTDTILLELTGTFSLQNNSENELEVIIETAEGKYQKDLVYLRNQMKKPGYLDEVKSLISEFMQYEIKEEELDEMIRESEDKTLLQMKLQDVKVLYQAFREYLSGHFMTAEEVLEVQAKEIQFSEKLKGSVLLLDGYTGFTPVQLEVLRELLAVCERVSVTVTMDVREQFLAMGKPHELFYMSHKMIRSLAELTKDIEEPVWVVPGRKSRFADAPALDFLEQHLFRYHRAVYERSSRRYRSFRREIRRKKWRKLPDGSCGWSEKRIIVTDRLRSSQEILRNMEA